MKQFKFITLFYIIIAFIVWIISSQCQLEPNTFLKTIMSLKGLWMTAVISLYIVHLAIAIE